MCSKTCPVWRQGGWRLERRRKQLGKTQHPKEQESTHSHLLRATGTAEKLRTIPFPSGMDTTNQTSGEEEIFSFLPS